MPALDNMMLFRCVAVTRRLQLKNREVGVICNIGAATLADPVEFNKLLQAFFRLGKTLIDLGRGFLIMYSHLYSCVDH